MKFMLYLSDLMIPFLLFGQQKMLPVKVTEKKLIPAEDVVTKRKRQFQQPDIAG